jgi:hypothetical protein
MKPRPLFAPITLWLAAILMFAAGCGEQNPAAPQLEPSTVAAARGGVGRQANIIKRAHRAGRYTNHIGPEGGTLDFGIGSLSIPAGALDSVVLVTAKVNGRDLAVDFQPHGLIFRPGHEPTLSFALAGVLRPEAALQIVYVDEWMTVLETFAHATPSSSHRVDAAISHFSTYCLAG